MVLVLVLIVVSMLTLGAYSFSEIMLSENEATNMYGRQAQSRAYADSGIELAAALLSSPESLDDENYYHNPDRFQAILMRSAEVPRGRGLFACVAPVETDPSGTRIRFGLIDESGKINVNEILSFELDDYDSREMLMYLPNMTEEIADSILDWIDDDNTMREFGVETDYYETLEFPYEARNGKLESIEELLKVAGVTTELLYGEDANRNGLLDPNENDGDESLPLDNADGVLNPGWASFLTTESVELNLRFDGEDRINVNNGILTDLYDKLAEEFDEPTAQFVVAFRLFGPVTDVSTEDLEDLGLMVGGAQASPNAGASSAELAEAINNLGQAIAGAIDGDVTRAGMDLSGGAQFEIRSIYELVGITIESQAEDSTIILESPWPNDASLTSYLPDLLDVLTVVDGSVIRGRVNVNQARLETLYCIPGITEDIAQAIVSSPMISDEGSPITDQIGVRASTGWLVTQGIVDLPTMIELDRYLTSRGHVFTTQVVGYFEEGGGYTRLQAVIDATQVPARITSVSDLTELGRGYTTDMLNGILDK
jgi:hypothetical protein